MLERCERCGGRLAVEFCRPRLRPGCVLMFVSKAHEAAATLAALNCSHAVIAFKMDGTILTANENFLGVTGYRLADISGRSHAIFIAVKERHSTAYQRFWGRLEAGRVPGWRVCLHRQARSGGLAPGDLPSDPQAKRQAVQGHRFRHRHHRAHRADAGRDGGASRLAPEALMFGRARAFDASGQGWELVGWRPGDSRIPFVGSGRSLAGSPGPVGMLPPAKPCPRRRSRPVGSGMWWT